SIFYLLFVILFLFFFFSSRRRHTRSKRDWSSDVCSSDLAFVTDSSPPRTITFFAFNRLISASVSFGKLLALVNKMGALCNDANGDPVKESANFSPFVRITVADEFHPDLLISTAFL